MMHYINWLIQNPPFLIYNKIGATPPPPSGFFLLFDGTNFLLLDDGSFLMLLG